LEAVVLFDRLVIEVFSVNHEKDLVDVGKLGGKLRGLEGGERFTAARGMPNIAARLNGAGRLIVCGYLDTGKDALRSSDLVGTHNKELVFGCKDAVLCEDIQQGLFSEEGLGKVHKVSNRLVLGIRPVGSKFKAIAGFLTANSFRFRRLSHMI